MLVRRSSNAVGHSVCILRQHPRSVPSTLWYSLSASETFNATAKGISDTSSTPLILGDRRKSMEPSRCPDFVCETMVSHVLNCTPILASLA